MKAGTDVSMVQQVLSHNFSSASGRRVAAIWALLLVAKCIGLALNPSVITQPAPQIKTTMCMQLLTQSSLDPLSSVPPRFQHLDCVPWGQVLVFWCGVGRRGYFVKLCVPGMHITTAIFSESVCIFDYIPNSSGSLSPSFCSGS